MKRGTLSDGQATRYLIAARQISSWNTLYSGLNMISLPSTKPCLPSGSHFWAAEICRMTGDRTNICL